MSRIYPFRLLPVLLALVVELPAQLAAATPYGSGCYFGRRSFYEMFATGTVFDLAGTIAQPGGFTMLNISSGFLMLPLSTGWHPQGPGALSLPLTDDSVQTVQLGFTLQLPTGPTTQITVCSNGFVYLHAGSLSPFTPTSSGLLSGDERLAVCFTDLNPGVGGTVTFETTPGVDYLTFNSVPEFAGTGTATFQVVFRAYGQIDVLYGPMSMTARARLVGYSPGGGGLDPGPRDLSQANVFLTDPRDEDPLLLTTTGRPVIGTTVSFTLVPLSSNSVGSLFALGAQQLIPPIELAAVGMPGCSQHTSMDSVQLMSSSAGGVVSLLVPNSLPLLGVQVFAQGAASLPGRNSLQWVSSNGLALLIGSF